MSPDRRPTEAAASSPGGRVRARLGAGLVLGGVLAGSALLGAGSASAVTCPAPGQPIPTILASVCKPVSTVVNGATAPVQSAPTVVPQVVGGATAPVTGAVTGATGGGSASGPTVITQQQAAPQTGAQSAPSTAAAAPAPAAAPGAPPPAAAPVAAPTVTAVAFDMLPASFLSSAAVPGGFGSLGPTASLGAVDPGVLLTSSQPLRSISPAGRVTSSSTAQPMSFLAADGRIGMPVMLSVLVGSAVLALAVRSGVLRRMRRRAAA